MKASSNGFGDCRKNFGIVKMFFFDFKIVPKLVFQSNQVRFYHHF